MKLCRGCNTEKPLDDFHRRSTAKDGRQSRCKDCQKVSAYDWRDRHPERSAEHRRNHYEKTGRGRQYHRLYGVTAAQVEAIREAQGARCAICGRPEAESRNGRLHVDHDHESGGVRGLLCHLCNTALGKFEDDRDRLYTAILYLDRYRDSLP